MSIYVICDVTILTPTEYDRMVVSEQDNVILFFSKNNSKILRFRFDKIQHVSLYSKREHKVQIKFISNHKRELKFKSSDETDNFFQAMKSMAALKKLNERCKIVQPPVRGSHVKKVVQQFETLRKKNDVEVVAPKTENVPGPYEAKEQVVNFNEPLESNPPTLKNKLPNGIMKVWKYLTVKPKPKVFLFVAPKPLAPILMPSN